jgi:hypothetical protein
VAEGRKKKFSSLEKQNTSVLGASRTPCTLGGVMGRRGELVLTCVVRASVKGV